MSELTEGDQAPDFELAAANGPLKLADFNGKALVVFFYPKDDTPGCTTESKDFSALAEDFAQAGVALLGVSKDSVASHAKFTAKHGLTAPLGSDPEGAMIARYGSWVQKKLYGREYMGIDRSTFLIAADGKVARIWRKVRVPGHAAAVLEAAKAL